jgi:hypothetical protein
VVDESLYLSAIEGFLHYVKMQQKKDALFYNEEVKTWQKKIKRKKAINLQQNLAVIMS